MARRRITRTKFSDQGKIIPEVVAVVSAKDKNVDLNTPQKYFKRNYLDAIRTVIPPFYLSEEKDISGTHVSYPNQLINSHILANANQATILPVSSLGGDEYLSSLGTPVGFARFFYKTYSPASISPDDFERNILFKLGKSYQEFSTSTAFQNYISGTFLPSIPSLSDADINLATTTASAFDNTSSGTYSYLVKNLGWLYFLNRNGSDEFTPSTAVTELMTQTLYRGQPVVLEDLINIYQEHLWKGQASFGLTEKIIPLDYVSSLAVSSNTNTSGSQLIDRLKILNTINYSPHYMDSPDVKIEDAFTTFFDTSTILEIGTLITDTEEAGPLARFLQAMSFSFADRLTEQDEIGILYDIGKCPDEFLELLAELIGWRFIGADIDKWRVQLRSAVEIYKMKGTKRSIQLLMDTLFSTGVFNITTSDTLSELWESYVPDLIYYSLATSSDAFQRLGTHYTEEVATQFGIPHYSNKSMDLNIKYAVDKIMFDLVRDFPSSFLLAGKRFPTPEFVYSGTDTVYTGPYHLMNPMEPETESYWMTGMIHDADSGLLELKYDPDFTFVYRNHLNYIPPYEKRQYYTQSQLTPSMVDRIEFYLRCFGCDASFSKEVTDYIRDHTNTTVNIDQVLNNFLLFTKKKTYPPNYATILRDVTKQRTPDPASLLSLWNGKSSHFFMSLTASSFDFTNKNLRYNTSYGLSKIMPILDQVIPAHAIPEILLNISSVADALDALGDKDCREWRPNFDDLYEGSSTVTTGFGVCAVDMGALALANGIAPHRFKRFQVDNVTDVLLSGNTFQAVDRNALRRRNFHNLLPETKMFTRNGRNNPGSLELSSPYYSSGFGYLPLGFMPSSLKYKEVALSLNTNGYGIGLFLSDNIDPVWDICQNLTSPSSMFGYDISNTFASRAKQDVASSDCNTYGRRGQLQEIMYVMNTLHDREKYLQASSIVSGYYDEWGTIDPTWPTSSTLITPNDLSSWYAEQTVYGGLNIIGSIANQLINNESSDESLNYYEHFTFGYKVLRLYDSFNKLYKAHGTSNNYNLMGGANIFSHTYGPYIYNSDFDIDGSGLEASGFLSASSTVYEVDISYNGGSGVLSISGVSGDYGVGTSAASSVVDAYIGSPEFRNPNLVSAIELVDSSVGWTFGGQGGPPHPVFSLFNLSRNEQSKQSFNPKLINNQIIKYHRPSSNSSFPRIRIPIHPNSGHSSENFFQPDHEYEIDILAHCLDVSGFEIGGLTLGVLIHTEPEDNKLWYYDTQVQDECGLYLDRWSQCKVSQLSGDSGIAFAISKAQATPFTVGNLENYSYSGEGGGMHTINTYAKHCWEPFLIGTEIVWSNPLAINNVSDQSQEHLKFSFSTKNNKAVKPSAEYRSQFGKVHRTDQKYVIEIFVVNGHPNKFVVFEKISIKDLTNKSNAKVQSKYGDIDLSLFDLKTIFKYFKTLSNGLASRNAVNTSSVMEVSGGSRLNYRSNVDMYVNSRNSDSNQLESITINEG